MLLADYGFKASGHSSYLVLAVAQVTVRLQIVGLGGLDKGINGGQGIGSARDHTDTFRTDAPHRKACRSGPRRHRPCRPGPFCRQSSRPRRTYAGHGPGSRDGARPTCTSFSSGAVAMSGWADAGNGTGTMVAKGPVSLPFSLPLNAFANSSGTLGKTLTSAVPPRAQTVALPTRDMPSPIRSLL